MLKTKDSNSALPENPTENLSVLTQKSGLVISFPSDLDACGPQDPPWRTTRQTERGREAGSVGGVAGQAGGTVYETTSKAMWWPLSG